MKTADPYRHGFINSKTQQPRTVEEEAAANTYPHVNAAWCHCAKCSNHAEYIHNLAARIDAALAKGIR